MRQQKRNLKPNRGHHSELVPALWPELRQREESGETLKEIAAWLLSAHGIKVSVPSVSRALARIRPVDLAAAEEARLETYLDRFHRHATTDTLSVQAQISAARLVIAVMAEQRARRQTASPAPPLPGAPAAAPAAQMTPEEEAEAARAQLGKLN